MSDNSILFQVLGWVVFIFGSLYEGIKGIVEAFGWMVIFFCKQYCMMV